MSGNVPVAQPVIIPVDGGNGGEAQQVEYEAGEHADLGGQVVRCWWEKTKNSTSVFVSWRTCQQKRKRGAPSFGRYAARQRSAIQPSASSGQSIRRKFRLTLRPDDLDDSQIVKSVFAKDCCGVRHAHVSSSIADLVAAVRPDRIGSVK